MKPGDVIASMEDELYIQIPKDRIVNDDVGSDLFRPRQIDDGKKSMDWGAKVTRQASFEFHQIHFGSTGGVCTAKVLDFAEHQIQVIYDPLDGPPKNEAHCYADYSGVANSRQKIIAKKIKRAVVGTLNTFS